MASTGFLQRGKPQTQRQGQHQEKEQELGNPQVEIGNPLQHFLNLSNTCRTSGFQVRECQNQHFLTACGNHTENFVLFDYNKYKLLIISVLFNYRLLQPGRAMRQLQILGKGRTDPLPSSAGDLMGNNTLKCCFVPAEGKSQIYREQGCSGDKITASRI